jgi:hypothetical protein
MFKQPIFKIFILLLVTTSIFAFPKSKKVKKKYYLPSGTFAMGIAMGSQTGVTFKKYTSKKVAYSGVLSTVSGDDSYTYVNLNYLVHNHIYFSSPSVSMYYGFGAKSKDGKNEEYGFRIPFGITYLFKKSPFDVFMEVAPEIVVTPNSEFGFSFFTGGRFWF